MLSSGHSVKVSESDNTYVPSNSEADSLVSEQLHDSVISEQSCDSDVTSLVSEQLHDSDAVSLASEQSCDSDAVSPASEQSCDSDVVSLASEQSCDVSLASEQSCDSEQSHADVLFSDHDDDFFEVDPKMFEPIYDNASVSKCGAYCAIMEFKHSCRLPFSCIDKLLQLLQLLCPANNSLPCSVYMLRKFFKTFSSSQKKRKFCSDCKTELCDQREKCTKVTCRPLQPSTLITLNPIEAIKRVLTSEFT